MPDNIPERIEILKVKFFAAGYDDKIVDGIYGLSGIYNQTLLPVVRELEEIWQDHTDSDRVATVIHDCWMRAIKHLPPPLKAAHFPKNSAIHELGLLDQAIGMLTRRI